MKIHSIETYTREPVTIVRVRADDGTEGWGQAAPSNAGISALILHRQLARHALGQEASDIGAVVERCVEGEYKTEGPHLCRALAGLDTALWDLRGKAEGKSICELLGGTPRPLDVYASSMRRDTSPEEEADRLKRAQEERGFRAFKFKIGRRQGKDADQWPGRTEALLEAARQTLGNDAILYVDANSAYSPERAIEVGRMLEEYGVCHFEEPCPFQELEWTAQVAEALEIPVAGGEQDCWISQFHRMIRTDAVDVVQPDLCYVGGLSRAFQVARMAREAGKPCTPHAANPSLVAVFTMHLLTAIPNPGRFMEYSIENSSWAEGLYAPFPRVEGGKIAFPEGPGWGVEIRPEWLESAEYQVSSL
ncbi:MAG: mandelate racemase/muconate lactonizing enzyme family protein [Armatimonadetes bacterium]|nr:mandelate racemase/muconate lactonizing enzyme family protein [Armatimonadota bacterium]